MTEGGWTWWCEQWKLAHPEETPDYKTLIQKYIKGENPNEATNRIV
ncbi:hypothetical protein REC_4 [Pseudomonas phage REC]|nr:hypothetical protein REC_4 [Pseudomonas phage REC]